MPQPSSPTRPCRIMKEFVISELAAVDRPAQRGARAVLLKSANAGTAAAVLGVEIPAHVADASGEMMTPPLEMNETERRRFRERAAALRDHAEREARVEALAAAHLRTLADLDTLLEARASELAGEAETMVAAFTRLVASRSDEAFNALLEGRERVALEGVGTAAG